MNIQVVFYGDRKYCGIIQAESLPFARKMAKRWIATQTLQTPSQTTTSYPTGIEYSIHSNYTSYAATISIVN